jgi:hypothetical protein
MKRTFINLQSLDRHPKRLFPIQALHQKDTQLLFKYLPAQYADSVLDGEILFRNLVFFKRIEDDPRRDLSEGTHISAPDSDYTITNLSKGGKVDKVRWPFHNILAAPERVFCFCTSTILRADLQKKLEMRALR